MLFTVLLIALGLAMDAFAVSISNGVTRKYLKFWQAVEIALFFGGFQALMPLLGWSLGLTVRTLVESFANWIAFFLLAAIGSKMIYESFQESDPEADGRPLTLLVLLALAVATSLDALAVGVSFAFIKFPILWPSLLIGVVTFVISLVGVYIGKVFGEHFESKAETVGGLVLIGIGLKILLF